MTVNQLDPLGSRRWADLVERHSRSSVFHTVEWLTALQRTYGFEPVVFTTSGDSAVENGLAFCRVRSWMTGRRLVSLPFSDHCDPLVDDPGTLSRLLESFRQRLGREGRYIEVRPLTVSPMSGYSATAQYVLHTLDLRPDADAIFGSFHRSHVRRAVRRAERSRVSIECGNSPGLLRQFYRLHILTRQRHRVPVQPYAWFENLSHAFADGLRVYLATIDRRSIAAIVTLRHKQTLVYKYGGSDAEYHRYGAMAALIWRAITDAKADGCVAMDLGRSDADQAGLIAFKDHLGGERRTLTYYRHSRRPPRQGGSRFRVVLQDLFARAPRSAQLRIGQRLYRHLG